MAREGSAAYEIVGTGARVADIPVRLRPREEIDRRGIRNVSDDVLLAVILRSGAQGRNVVDLARGLVTRYGSLTELSGAPIEELVQERGLGKVKAQVLAAALELGRRLSEEAAPERPAIRTPEDVYRTLKHRIKGCEQEMFWVLLLDAKNRIKSRAVPITNGLLDASLVHPREVFREAIRSAVAAVVLAHNHPSGDPVPSAEDIRITRQLVEAGRVIDIKVLDHVVMGGLGARPFCSMREEGILEFS